MTTNLNDLAVDPAQLTASDAGTRRPRPARAYTIPGFRISLVREPGVRLAERPALTTPREAAPILAQFIGESDRERFVVAMLTIRHRVIGLHTVSVGCLSSSLVAPREVFKVAILSGSAALLLAHYVARNIMSVM